MLRNALLSILVIFTHTLSFSSADDDLPILNEQRAEALVVPTSVGTRIFLEEPTPYPRSDFNTFVAAHALAQTYAPVLPKADVEETLCSLEKLLGNKSFTPRRHQLYSLYIGRWTPMPGFQSKVQTLLAHEDFLFPSPYPPKPPADALFSQSYALDNFAKQGIFYVYDRSVLFPEYFALSNEEITNRINILTKHMANLFSNAYGPLFSRIRAHMVHGFLSMEPEIMTARLDFALAELDVHPSSDPFTNMAMLTTYASKDAASQKANLEAFAQKLPFLMPEIARGSQLFHFRRGVCVTLPFEKIELFSKPEAQIFFTDCSDVTKTSPSSSLSDRQYLELNNFLLSMPTDKILPLGGIFLGLHDLGYISAHDLRDIAVRLSNLSVEQLETLVSHKDALFTSGMTPNDLKNFAIFAQFTQTQIRATARLMKEIRLPEPFSLSAWESVPKLVYFHLTSEQTRAVLCDEAGQFMANLGDNARPVFIFEGIKKLEGDKLRTLFACGIPLFPSPLNDDPTYLRETTAQIKELEASEIPVLVQEITSFGEPPSSPRIATTVESLVTVRLNSPRGSLQRETHAG